MAPVMQHVALLFWLVGAIRPRSVAIIGVGDGTAQFAICQAMDKLNIAGQCLGIGFWRDLETDRVLGEAPENLRAHSALLYDDIATLQSQDSLNKALTAISPGSLDLLVLEACNLPTDNEPGPSVKDWLTCLNPDGVLLVHGLSKSSLSCANRAELADAFAGYPTMELPDEEGLFVAARQGGQPSPLTTLLSACHNGMLPGETAQLFRRLGQGHLAVAQKEDIAATNRNLRSAINTAKHESDEAQRVLGELQDAYEARSLRLAEIQKALFERDCDNFDLKQRLDASLAESAKALAAYETQTELRFSETATLTQKLEDHAKQSAHALAKTTEILQQRDTLKQQLAASQAAESKALRALEQEKNARFSETAALTLALEEQAKSLKGAMHERKEGARQVEVLAQQLTDVSAEKCALSQRIDALLNSTSWRVTAPLRRIKSGMVRVDPPQS